MVIGDLIIDSESVITGSHTFVIGCAWDMEIEWAGKWCVKSTQGGLCGESYERLEDWC